VRAGRVGKIACCSLAAWAPRGRDFAHAENPSTAPLPTLRATELCAAPGMGRREFITLLGGAAVLIACPLPLRAQQPQGRPLIGVLSPISAALAARNMEALRQGLREFGYVEGRNIAFEFRYAEGELARLPALAAELVALQPAVIIAGSAPAALAAREATRAIPIVIASVQDPMALGLAASMARPGGNVTGIWSEGDDSLIGKRLELFKDAVPGASRLAVFVDRADASDVSTVKAVPAAARLAARPSRHRSALRVRFRSRVRGCRA
jgi:putative tryptophan/tyrosine transport system substrate-binding protein